MEHETQIRNKIRILESAPVSWNKREVWSAIRKENKIGAKRIYYYAAAILMFALVLTYSIQLWYKKDVPEIAKTPEREVHGKQNQPLETKRPVREDIEVSKIVNTHVSVESLILSPQPGAMLPDHGNDSLSIQKNDSIAGHLTRLSESIAIQNRDTLTVEKMENQVSTVEPIIGVYFPKGENIARRKEKRLRIKLFAPQEQRYAGNHISTPLISARIN